MTPHQTIDDTRPGPAIAELIARHGYWRILRATLAALIRDRPPRRPPPPKPTDVRRLNDHILRDIGLSPSEASPKYWDVLR